ncbi:MAG TPA: cobyrinate a,c-diamide synthase, partial [Stellaceae bacterium]|nr:cobyrinate a,c-diamide synthase [Stellaceae bacterium]
LRVAAAKAGPDYIDPGFHAAAGGGPCVNLDPWAMRPATLAGLVGASERHPLWCDHLPSPPRKRGSRGDRPSLALDSRWRGNDDTLCSHTAEIVLCEGVMGLFDGTGPDGEQGSTAALARLTGWPVVLVVDARRQGASAAALVGGFARHDPAVRLAGIIFNRVAGARHRALLEAAMARHLPDIPCLGAVPDDPALMLPERHLGLVPARESGAAAEAVIVRAAEAIGEALDVDRLVALARPASLTGEKTAPLPPLGAHIAVAHDDAFLFSYPAILHGWRRQGAELSFFSPLGDEAPNPAADAVFLPGGYPELHAGRLAACGGFIAGLRRAAGLGATIYGECGGYMALGESLTDADGRAHRMAGLLPLETSFAARRLHLGYRQATLMQAGPLGPAGAHFRGHEFHYAATVAAEGEPLFALSDACGDDLGPSGLRRGTVMGSFIHLIDQAD